jgi:uncharacterized protein YukE
MITISQQVRSQASKAALHWLNLAAKLPQQEAIAFLNETGARVGPMFNRDVNQAFLHQMQLGKDPRTALQNALINVMANYLSNPEMGMGTDKEASSNFDWASALTSGANALSTLADTTFNIVNGVRTSRADARAAQWQQEMDANQQAFEQEMARLQADQMRLARDATANSQAPVASRPTILAPPQTNNIGLYVALGVGAVALLGFAFVMTRKP